MASPSILDIPNLLTPISDDSEVGEDLREDYSATSPYQSIKADRNAARASERNNIHDVNGLEADGFWRNIVSNAPAVITSHSKDLEIASWLTEALVRRHGIQGLRDGFLLMQGLVTTFWDGLYPIPDEDGIETRVAPLSGLNGEGAEGVLIAPIRRVKITEGGSTGPFSLWEYQQALNNDKITDDDLKDKKIAQLGLSLEDVEKAVNESSVEFFVNLRDDLDVALDTYKNIGQTLDSLCGMQDAPSTRNITDVLEECRGAISHIARNKFPSEALEPEEDAEQDAPAGEEISTPTQAAAPPKPAQMTREIAFKQISDLAEFFRKTEPHSPVSYLLEKSVKWGEMPLTELIQELISDNNSLERFSDLTGVKVEN